MKIAGLVIAMVYFGTVSVAAANQAGGEAPVAPRLSAGAPGAAAAPGWLSETGLYADAAKLKIDPRNRVFSPQYPLWSDGATKRRWVQLPVGSQINVADLAKWELPVGTKFWKEFSFQGRKVETRFLWQIAKNQWVFASYAWNAAQTDAELASEKGVAGITEVADNKRHSIPSIQECRSCHDSSRTEILGFDALQLSDDRDPNALHAETLTPDMITLRTLVNENLITPKRTELVTNPPRIAAGSPQTRAALGYLSTNCGNCHNRESSIASLGLSLKHTVPENSLDCTPALATTVGKRGHWVVPEAQDASRIINPGHPQMPPIGTVVADRKAVDLLTSWVQSNPEEWQQMVARCAAQGS